MGFVELELLSGDPVANSNAVTVFLFFLTALSKSFPFFILFSNDEIKTVYTYNK